MNKSTANTLLTEAGRLEAAGDRERALAKLQQAAKIDSGNVAVQLKMGQIYRDLGQPREAIKVFEFVHGHFPKEADICAELALSWLAAEDLGRAYDLAKKAIALDENSDFSLSVLGNIATLYERWGIAAQCYEKLAGKYPKDPVAFRFWSNALNKAMQFEEAAGVYQKVIALDGITFEHAYNMGRFYFSARDFKKAEPYYQQALELEPGEVGPYLALARCRIQSGDVKEGERLTRKALAIKPDYIYAFTLLNDLRPEENNPETATLLEQKLAKGQWEGELEKAHTHLFLGKYYHKEKRFDEAFKNFKAYNDTRYGVYEADRLFYDPGVMEGNFAETKKLFSKEGLKKLEGCGSDSEVPVFIVAMPRSGTTLLEQIIATHSGVHGAGEMATMIRIFMELNFKINVAPDRDIYDIIRGEARGWAEMYLDSLHAPKGVQRVTDKMPVNFIYCGLIQAIFPKARIIHIKRSPLDNCLSMYSNSFSESYAYSARLDHLGHYYNLYGDLMAHWKKTLSMSFMDIQYEDLVENQEQKSREILEFCGLPWEDRVLEFYKGQKAAFTISQVQVSKPINKRGIARWKPYEKYIAPLINALDEDIVGPLKD